MRHNSSKVVIMSHLQRSHKGSYTKDRARALSSNLSPGPPSTSPLGGRGRSLSGALPSLIKSKPPSLQPSIPPVFTSDTKDYILFPRTAILGNIRSPTRSPAPFWLRHLSPFGARIRSASGGVLPNGKKSLLKLPPKGGEEGGSYFSSKPTQTSIRWLRHEIRRRLPKIPLSLQEEGRSARRN